MRIESARRNVDLIPGSIHVVEEYAGCFGKNLPWILLREVCVQRLDVNDLVFLADIYLHALNVG